MADPKSREAPASRGSAGRGVVTRHVSLLRLLACASMLGPVLVTGCSDDDDPRPGIDAGSDADLDATVTDGSRGDAQVISPDAALPVVGDTWGYTSAKRFVKFQRSTGKLEQSLSISGLGDETVLGVDMRPANGAVTVLTNLALYTLDLQTGALAGKLSLSADPADTSNVFSGSLPLATTSNPPVAVTYGVDFNPVADRLRVVSSTGRNLRINPNNGLVATDPGMTPVVPVTGAG